MLALFVATKMLLSSIPDRLHREDDGATAVEYGLLVALIAAVIVVTVGLLGQQILTAFETVVAALP